MTHSLDNNIIPFLAVIITYFGLLTYIGYYATKQTRTLRDYFTMSGKAGALLSGLAYFSTQYSMSTFMGVPGTIYKVGYAGMSVSVPGIAFSMVIPALLVGRRLIRLGHRYRMLTMADYISDRYESTLMRALLAIIMILFLVPMMGAQTIGAGIIFKTYTGAPEWVGIVVMGITVILYCMAGGIRSIMITDVIQGILMVATAVVTFFVSLQLGGGLEVINQYLADTDMSLLSHPGQNNSMPWQNYVSMIIMWSFFTIGQPHLFTKFFTMKNYNVMFKAVLLGTLGMWFSATLIEWCGVTGRMSFPNLTGTDTDFIVPLILQAGVHPVISSLMVAGIFSAGMSTVSGVLITSTSAVTRDLYQKIFNKEATDKDAFIMSRYVTVGLGVLAICIGIYKPSSIFQLVLFSFGGLGIWAAPILAGLYWKRATKVGAFASVIVGEIVYILLTTTFTSLTFGFNPLIVAWIIAMVVLIVVSLCTKPVSAETIRRHFDDLEKC
ncbi:sodium:solute symporter family transporter [Megamonas funiformis]|uniref:sodium:solute symporter family transporter n=1 Tax=Megamonas funiformis TaxID=437897 RepID=UPI0035211F6F